MTWMMIEVYTDGSATTKDKPGGWAFVILVDGILHQTGSGSLPKATNNDAELEAAIMGLAELVKMGVQGDHVTLVSDSEIVLKWANGTHRFKQIDKIKKYEQLLWLMKRFHAHTRWVEGHAGHEFNEMCDKMAKAERYKAMGIVKKNKPSSKKLLKPLKEACEKMASTLEWIRKEMLQMEAEGTFVRHDIEDQCDEALNFYKEKVT